MFKYFIAAFLTISLLIFPVSYPAAGGLSSEIDNMFNNFGFKTNSTAPGAYMAQTHGMIAGGSLNVRSSSKPVELFSISPPSIKAGCGGLDMYFGGVSFVNLQQFQQMLLAIGQNAVGYAFELGIEAVCLTCNSVLKDLKNYASQLNKLRTDSCTAAKQLVNWTAEAGADAAINSCTQSKIDEDGADPDQARKDCLDADKVSAKITSIVGNAKAAGQKPPIAQPGISTWKALTYTNLSDEDKLIAMNLTGTYARSMTDASGNPTIGSTLEWNGPTITLRDLMYGKQEAELLSPDPSDTEGNGVMEVKTMDLEGYKPRVVDKINAIMPKLQAGTTLAEEEKQFIDASRIPMRYLLEMTQGNQGLQNAAFDLMIDLIILDMAWSTVKTYISYVEMNIGKQSVVDGDKALDQIAQVKNGFYGELTKTMQDFETAARSYEMTEFFEKQLKKATNQAVTRSSSAKGGH